MSPAGIPTGLLLSRKLSLTLLVAYALLLAWLSLTPTTAPPADYDKLLHFLAYSGFVLLGWPFALAPGSRELVVLVLISALYGLALEAGQSLVPGRVASPGDALANLAGSIGGAIFLLLVKSLRDRPA